MVLITRPEKQALILSTLLNAKNIDNTIFPTLAIKPLFPSLNKNYQVVIFISQNAVHFGTKYLTKLSNYQLLTIGEITAKTLENYGFKPDFYPKKNPSSQSLLEIPSVAKINNKNILIIRGRGGVETLKTTLVKNNNIVDYLEVYSRISNPNIDYYQTNLTKFLASKNQIISITSNDNLKFLLKLSNKIDKNILLIVISDRIKNYAIKYGFSRIIVTKDISNNAIIQELKKWSY